MDCRQETALTFFGVWPLDEFDAAGETLLYAGRRFLSSVWIKDVQLRW
jgi:hypothetical protein